MERSSEETLKNFIVGCVLNEGHLSKSNEQEITADMIKNAERDKYYIAPRKDNIIMSEKPAELESPRESQRCSNSPKRMASS